MAVLIEAISVVVRADAILRAFDDWEAFKALAPNRTLCADGELCRVGFMDPHDIQRFIHVLETRSLIFQRDGRAVDIVVVDQLRGPTTTCDWVEFGHVPHEGGAGRIACCRLNGSPLTHVSMPDGWLYEESLSSSYGFVPSEHVDSSLRFLRHEDGLDVYLSPLSDQEVYVARDIDTGGRSRS